MALALPRSKPIFTARESKNLPEEALKHIQVIHSQVVLSISKEDFPSSST